MKITHSVVRLLVLLTTSMLTSPQTPRLYEQSVLTSNEVGQTWKSTQNLRQIAAVNVSAAWADGEGGGILHTGDGGTTWTRQFSVVGRLPVGISKIPAATGGNGLV